MIISKVLTFSLLKKASPKNRFDVFLSPFVAHRAVDFLKARFRLGASLRKQKFAFVYTAFDVHRLLSNYSMNV